jgi:hypothetical protein
VGEEGGETTYERIADSENEVLLWLVLTLCT